MSSVPPPPDNPTPSTVEPLGPQQSEAASPPAQPSDVSALPSEPPSRTDALCAHKLVIPLLQLGPTHAFWSPGNDWFTCASSLVTAIGDGYKAISAIPPEQHTLLDQLPDFSQINSSLSTSLAKTAACSYTQEKSFQQELRTWIDNETNATHHRIFPALQAKADKYRTEHEAELMSAAAREAEIMTDLRTAQHRSRAKTRGKSPPFPHPSPPQLHAGQMTSHHDRRQRKRLGAI